jgi:hypothetical protein
MTRWLFPEADAALALALALGTVLVHAQTPAPAAGKDCGSIVIVRCEPPPAKAASPARSAAATRDTGARVEARRQEFADPFELDRVIIEADPIRRSLEEALSAPFDRPAHGTHTFLNADGSTCSCMNRCPPVPLPCCACAAPPRSYATSPGSPPLQ